MATLIVLTPPAAGTRLTVEKNRHAVLGRDPTCDLVLEKQSISRFHAQVMMSQGAYYLEDMKSTNGTFLNGRKVQQRVTLKDGDRITMHDVPIVFFLSDNVSSDTESTIKASLKNVLSDQRLTDVDLAATLSSSGDSLLKGRLKTLIEIAQDLGSTLDLEEILPRILDVLFRMFPPAVIGEIHLVGPDKKLTPVAMKHGREADSTDLTGAPFNLNLIQQVFQTGQGMIRTERPGNPGSALEEPQQSIVCAPIQGPDQEPWGVILLETEDSSYVFSPDDLELISAVAVLAGQAIGYSRAHEIVVQHDTTVRQLETARQIQLGMLPRSQPNVAGYDFSHHYAPAEKVGGDYFFYETLRDGRVILGLADASGKGLSAAMNIARFAGEVRLRIATSPTLKSALTSLNQFVIEGTDECLFITACLCVLDQQQNVVSIANAGHPPPLLKSRKTGQVSELVGPHGNLPLGVYSTLDPHPFTVKLEPGDQVVLFTDGVSEAMNHGNELFGTERLAEVLRNTSGSVGHLIAGLVQSVEQFRNGRTANDDTTAMAFERLM